MEKQSFVSIKKSYFDDERWAVLARGLNRLFSDLNIDLNVDVYAEMDPERGECIVIKVV